mmetsp:Transcript_11715/g.37298  ORF Transcript_11715/g.37298 Transcript_11715/m.37298 type:complete len:269 (-) Transcript_11715:581-1387(-)
MGWSQIGVLLATTARLSRTFQAPPRLQAPARASPLGASGVSKEFVDHYAVLGVAPNATAEEIRRSYRALSAACHPDAAGSDEEAFARVSSAYRTLRDQRLRASFDATRSADRVAQAADAWVDDVVVPLVRDVGVPAIKKAFEDGRTVAAAAGFVVAGPVGAVGAVAANYVAERFEGRRKEQSLTDVIAAVERRADELAARNQDLEAEAERARDGESVLRRRRRRRRTYYIVQKKTPRPKPKPADDRTADADSPPDAPDAAQPRPAHAR